MKQDTTLFGRPYWQIVLVVVFIAQVMTGIGFSMVFPFLPLYAEHLGSTTGLSIEMMAGLVISVQGITMMIASPLWGAAADRYGRKLMVMRASYGGACTLGLMGLAQSGEQLILLRGLQGLITGTVAANNALVASVAPRERIGFVMGTIQVSLWTGVALGPLIGGFLADLYGYSMPFFITSSLLAFSGFLIQIGIREDVHPIDEKSDVQRPSMIEQWRHVIGASGVNLVYLMRFLAAVGRTIIIPIAPLFVVSLLPPDTANQSMFAGSVLAVSSATSTFSAVYLGRLGDRIGHRTVLVWSAIVVVILYIPQIFVVTIWQLLGLQAAAGLAMGGILSAPSALLARYTEPGEEGAVYGIDNSIVAAARAVAPLVGAGVALWFGFRGTFAATAVLFVIVALASFIFLPHDELQPESQRMAAAVGD